VAGPSSPRGLINRSRMARTHDGRVLGTHARREAEM
jgi:hypothetical protein